MRSFLVYVLLFFFCLAPVAWADNAGTRDQLVKLPSAGGTVTKDESQLSVQGNKGAVNYSMRLPTLPQRSGAGGSLALSYSQFQGTEGTGLGHGWSFDLGAIEINEDKGTPLRGFKPDGNFYSTLSLNGQRLVFVGKLNDGRLEFALESSAQPIKIYYVPGGLEILTRDRFASVDSHQYQRSFDVRYPDGTREIYTGSSSEAEGDFSESEPFINRWPLSLRLKPVSTHIYEAVEYQYKKVGGRSYLTSLIFAGGASHYELDWTEKPAGFPRKASFKNSYEQTDDVLYTRIRAVFDGNVRQQWCFAYQAYNPETHSFRVITHSICQDYANGNLAGRLNLESLYPGSQLKAVYRFAGNATQLNSNTDRQTSVFMEYSDWTQGDLRMPDSSSLSDRTLVYDIPLDRSIASSLNSNLYTLADYNQDSIVDLIYNGTAGTKVFMGEGQLTDSFQVAQDWPLEGAQRGPEFASGESHFADFNGDSFVDILRFNATDRRTINMYRGDGHGGYQLEPRTFTIQDPASGQTVTMDDLVQNRGEFTDVNMDGTTDYVGTFARNGVQQFLICYSRYKTTNGQSDVRFICRSSPFPATTQQTFPLASRDFRLADLNGDNLPDLVQFLDNSSNKGYCLYPNNGDLYSLRPDFSLFGIKGGDSVCGNGRGRFHAIEGMDISDRLTNLWFVDVNGDGLNDMVKLDSSTKADLKVWLGLGDGRFASASRKVSLRTQIVLGENQNQQVKVVDIDADGQKEILLLNQGEEHPIRVIDFNRLGDEQLPKSNLLTAIENESSLRYDMRYSTSIDEYIRDLKHADLNEREPRSLHFPAVVLKKLSVSEGRSGESRQRVQVSEYLYHEPFYNPADRKFQGFGSVETISYGDSAGTEGSSLTRSEYYADVTGDQRFLAGQLQASYVYEFEPHGTYRGSLVGDQTLDPKNALLHALSNYSRTQDHPCGAGDGSEHYRYCKLHQKTLADWVVVPGRAVGSYFIRNPSETTESLNSIGSDVVASCQLPSHDASQRAVSQKTTLYKEDGSNLPREVETRQQGLDAPYGVRLPAETHRVEYEYEDGLADLGIFNLIKSTTAYSWMEGEAEEQVVSRLTHEYEANTGWIQSTEAVTYSRLQQMPREVQAVWKEQNIERTSFAHDLFGNITERDRGLGVTDTITYSEDGLFVRESRDSRDALTTLEYDERGYVKSMTDPRGLQQAFSYDGFGRLTQHTQSSGLVEEYRYRLGTDFQADMVLHRKQVKRRMDGPVEWSYDLNAYDSKGQLIASFDEGEYDEGGAIKGGVRATAMKDFNRNDNVTAEYTPFQTTFDTIEQLFAQGFHLDRVGLTAKSGVSGNELAKTRFFYDNFGNQIRTATAVGTISTTKVYNWGATINTNYRQSRLSQERKNACAVTIGYGTELHAQVDELGNVHRFARDAKGGLKRIQLAGESQPRLLVHDSEGHMEYQKVPGIRSEYQLFDSLGRRTHSFVYDRDGAFRHMQETLFDSSSRPSSLRVDGQDQVTYRYDSYTADQLARVQAVAPQAIQNPDGLLTSVQKKDPLGLYDYEMLLAYNAGGQVLVRQVVLIDLHADILAEKRKIYTETYGYGPDGTLLWKRDPFGVESRLRVGKNQLMAGADLKLPWAADVWESIITDMQYNPKGQIQGVDYRAGLRTRIAYENETLLMKEIKSYRNDRLELQDLSLDFDGLGNVVEIQDSLPSELWGRLNRSSKFAYNLRGELIKADWTQMNAAHGFDSAVPASYSYNYTPAGNISLNTEVSSQTWNSTTRTASGDSTGLLPLGPNDRPTTFDSLGRLVSNGKVLATRYDGLGQLICARTLENLVYYGYNHEGRRIYKKVVPADIAKTCEERPLLADSKKSFYPMSDIIVEPTGNQSFVFAGANRLARVEHGASGGKGQWFFYLKDHLQSSDVIIAADGTPVEQMVYKPYGDELSPDLSFKWKDHLKGAAKGKTPLERTHHRFTGHYLDDDTGLYQMGARYYDAGSGRFISPDPLYLAEPERCTSSVVSCNLYAYAANNPLSKVDPTGLEERKWYERAISYIPVVGSTVEAVRSGYQAYQDIRAGDYRSAMLNGGAALLNVASAVGEAATLGSGSVVTGVIKATARNAVEDLAQSGAQSLNTSLLGDSRAGKIVSVGLGMVNMTGHGGKPKSPGHAPHVTAGGGGSHHSSKSGGGGGGHGGGGGGGTNRGMDLPDDAMVCRGGACSKDLFTNGSGITTGADGKLSGVSTQARPGANLETLAQPFKNNQVGVTTAGEIRKAGGKIVLDGKPNNPNHATVSGITADQAEKLFQPTVQNPVPRDKRGN